MAVFTPHDFISAINGSKSQIRIFLFLAILILGVFVVMAFVRFAKKYSTDGFVEVFPWLLLSVEIRPTIEFATNEKFFSAAEEYNVSSIDSSEDMNLR